jgi:hypothetical protein
LLQSINLNQDKSDDADIVKLRNRILAVIAIASKCNQATTFDEIALMMPQTSKKINAKEFIQNDVVILAQIAIQNQLITSRGYECLFDERSHKEIISKEKLQTAIMFANSLLGGKSYFKLLAVCGSVAYGVASDNDDIDFFLVCQENRMWLTLAKTLLLARVADEKNFAGEVANHKDLLFAREFLSAKVLAGQQFYYDVLTQTEWIKQALPAFYDSKLRGKNESIAINEAYSRSLMLNIANTAVYVLLGSYLQFKAFLRNLSFKKKGKFKDLFEARITKGHCVYNSERYKELEKMYSLI